MLHELYLKFFQFNKKKPIEPTLYVLYMCLLEKWIENDMSSFELSTNEILKEVAMSRATINRTKILLREMGLIKYSSDKGGTSKFTLCEINEVIVVPIVEQSQVSKVPKMDIPKISQPLESVESKKIKVPVLPATEKPKEKTALPKNVPPFETIIEFAKTINLYDDATMQSHLRIKYDSWLDAGWKNGFGSPITNWKSTVRNAIPFLKESKTNIPIPTIQRPIVTYDE